MIISYEIAPSRGSKYWKLYVEHNEILNTYRLYFGCVDGTSCNAYINYQYVRGRVRYFVCTEDASVPLSIVKSYRLSLDAVAYSVLKTKRPVLEEPLNAFNTKKLLEALVAYKKKYIANISV